MKPEKTNENYSGSETKFSDALDEFVNQVRSLSQRKVWEGADNFFDNFGGNVYSVLRIFSIDIIYRLYVLVLVYTIIVWVVPILSSLGFLFFCFLEVNHVAIRILIVVFIMGWIVAVIAALRDFLGYGSREHYQTNNDSPIWEGSKWRISSRITVLKNVERIIFSLRMFSVNIMKLKSNRNKAVGMILRSIGYVYFIFNFYMFYFNDGQVNDFISIPVMYMFDFIVALPILYIYENATLLLSEFQYHL